MNYCHQQTFSAVLKQLAPSAAAITADELPSLLWAGAQLAAAAATSKHNSSRTCTQAGPRHSHPSSVPANDGVKGSVNSSKIAGLPGVVDFVLGAAETLTGGNVTHHVSQQ